MGWEINKAVRDALVAPHRVSRAVFNECDVVIVDMCSMGRTYGIGPSRTPRSVAKSILKNLITEGVVSLLIILFDDGRKNSPARKRLHLRRYKRATAADIERFKDKKILVEGRLYYPEERPLDPDVYSMYHVDSEVDWKRLWNSGSRGKQHAWKLIEEALQQEIIVWTAQKDVDPNINRFIVWHQDCFEWPQSNEPLLSELAARITRNNFGEADQRVHEAVRIISTHYSNVYAGIRIVTFDTDQILQLHVNDPLKIPTFLELKKDGSGDVIVSARGIQSMFGEPSIPKALSACWLLIAAGGVDYSEKGLAPFGFNHKECAEAASKGHEFMFLDDTGEMYIDPVGLRRALCQTKRTRKKSGNTELDAFNEQLNAITYCVALFRALHPYKTPIAGPEYPAEHNYLEHFEGTTIAEFLDTKTELKPLDLFKIN